MNGAILSSLAADTHGPRVIPGLAALAALVGTEVALSGWLEVRRARFALAAFEPIAGGAQLTWSATVQQEGAEKPVCVAELLTRCCTGDGA